MSIYRTHLIEIIYQIISILITLYELYKQTVKGKKLKNHYLNYEKAENRWQDARYAVYVILVPGNYDIFKTE